MTFLKNVQLLQYVSSLFKNRNKIFIGGLAPEITKDDLSFYFSQYGKITDSVIMVDKTTSNFHSNSFIGHSRGFGFVSMQAHHQVELILRNQPHKIKGRVVDCKLAIPKQVDDSQDNMMTMNNIYNENSVFNRKLFIGGLHQMVSEIELMNYFSHFGEVEQCIIMKDKYTGKSRGFGFIIFTNPDSANRVLYSQHGHFLLGKWIECKRAMPKENTAPKRQTMMMNNTTPSIQTMHNSLFHYQEGFKENYIPKPEKVSQMQKTSSFINYFNDTIKNPYLYKYFHYKLFDQNGEEVTGIVSSYKNREKTQLFIEDKKLSYSKSTNESESTDFVDNNYSINNIEFINKKNKENCFGPKKEHMSFTSNCFFKPY